MRCDPTMELEGLVRLARGGAVAADVERVEETQAVARDATQETYMRAFHRLRSLRDPTAFPAWLRRVALSTAHNSRRSRRTTLACFEGAADRPVLDEAEASWTEAQRQALATALLKLSA